MESKLSGSGLGAVRPDLEHDLGRDRDRAVQRSIQLISVHKRLRLISSGPIYGEPHRQLIKLGGALGAIPGCHDFDLDLIQRKALLIGAGFDQQNGTGGYARQERLGCRDFLARPARIRGIVDHEGVIADLIHRSTKQATPVGSGSGGYIVSAHGILPPPDD